MSEKLLESDFLMVDLTTIENKPTDDNTPNNNPNFDNQPEGTELENETNGINQITDWRVELKNRLDKNKQMSKESRKTEYEIKNSFFKEYFTWLTSGDTTLIKQLMYLGKALQDDLIKWGFKETVNPVVAFIKQSYVINNLLKPGLLHSNTYKIIHEAIVNKWIVDSDFVDFKDYNIIYCKDFYKKSLDQMRDYLMLQSQVLNPSSARYTQKTKIINKQIFFHIEGIDETDPRKYIELIKKSSFENAEGKTRVLATPAHKGTLNKLGLAKSLRSVLTGYNEPKQSHLSANGQQMLVDKLNTPAKRLAAIQYLSISSDSNKAKAALSSDKFGGVTVDKLIQATQEVSKILSGYGKISTKDANALVDSLLSDL
jgi:hypothetical protein